MPAGTPANGPLLHMGPASNNLLLHMGLATGIHLHMGFATDLLLHVGFYLSCGFFFTQGSPIFAAANLVLQELLWLWLAKLPLPLCHSTLLHSATLSLRYSSTPPQQYQPYLHHIKLELCLPSNMTEISWPSNLIWTETTSSRCFTMIGLLFQYIWHGPQMYQVV